MTQQLYYDYLMRDMRYMLTTWMALLLIVVRTASACSPPEHWRPQNVLERSRHANVVVLASVAASLREDRTSRHYHFGHYDAKLRIHCVLKGPDFPELITVSGFGYEPGLCTNSVAKVGKSYVFFLRPRDKGMFTVQDVNVQSASYIVSTRRMLKRLVRSFSLVSHGVLSRNHSTPREENRTKKCPSFKLLRQLMGLSGTRYKNKNKSQKDRGRRRSHVPTTMAHHSTQRPITKGSARSRPAVRTPLVNDDNIISTNLSNSQSTVNGFTERRQRVVDSSSAAAAAATRCYTLRDRIWTLGLGFIFAWTWITRLYDNR